MDKAPQAPADVNSPDTRDVRRTRLAADIPGNRVAAGSPDSLAGVVAAGTHQGDSRDIGAAVAVALQDSQETRQ